VSAHRNLLRARVRAALALQLNFLQHISTILKQTAAPIESQKEDR